MQKLLFETATLADGALRASKIAPHKGIAFDRASGIILDADPDFPNRVILSSTNLTVTFRTIVACLEMKIDKPIRWRVPSALFAGITSALPMASGSVVSLAQRDDPWIYIISGEAKAKLMPITLDTYPLVYEFDSAGMKPVSNLGTRLSQVTWACADTDSVLSGVHLDGDYLYGCDRNSMGFVPCSIPIDTPVTAPLAPLSGLIKTATDVMLRATDTKLEIMPDPYTQMSAVLYAEKYPDCKALVRDTYTGHASVPNDLLMAALNRTMVLVRGERLPRLILEFGPGWLRLDMDVVEVGRMVDKVEIGGGSITPFKIDFTPTKILDILQASGRPIIEMAYGPTDQNPIRFTDDNDFYAMAMPRVVNET